MFVNRCLIAGVFGLIGFWALCWWATRNRFTITNESGQVIRELTVSVSGDTSSFGTLTPGASGEAHFAISNEASFHVTGTLADGTRVDVWTGYVVWEEDIFGVMVEIRVLPEGHVESTH